MKRGDSATFINSNKFATAQHSCNERVYFNPVLEKRYVNVSDVGITSQLTDNVLVMSPYHLMFYVGFHIGHYQS